MRILRTLAAAALLTACTSTPTQEAREVRGSAGPPAGATTYLALGDSVAAGMGAGLPSRDGYVPLLAGRLSGRLGCEQPAAAGCPVRVRNLSAGGATTATLLRNQLPAALEQLANGNVRLVTVTIGGNDVFGPVVRGCAAGLERPTCRQAVQDSLQRVDEGVDRLLSELARAVEPHAVVAVMTYYNPLPSCELASLADLAAQVLEGTEQERGLNDVLRQRAGQHGAVVVETAGDVGDRAHFVGGSDCLHPSDAGHAAIAGAFDEQVGQLVAEQVS